MEFEHDFLKVSRFKLPKLVCPYCGFKNIVPTEAQDGDMGIGYCDVDDGGCDQHFAYRVDARVSQTTFKIEGQDVNPLAGIIHEGDCEMVTTGAPVCTCGAAERLKKGA